MRMQKIHGLGCNQRATDNGVLRSGHRAWGVGGQNVPEPQVAASRLDSRTPQASRGILVRCLDMQPKVVIQAKTQSCIYSGRQ